MWCPILGGLLVIVIFPGHARKNHPIVPRYDCDLDPHTFMNEGNQGPVGMFPWLGVIRVTLNEGAKLRIAITGAVLIRITFAIAIAEDISKIPEQILMHHSKAMFISSDDTPWLYAIRRYVAAPDFRESTMSSIALVELLLQDDPTPLMPICWQDQNYHLSHQHFAVGFTDERYILEKIAYDMLFINKTQCEIYYEKLDMPGNKKHVPAQYQCWSAMKNIRNCMWENGMILVSNYTGTWFLIGIGTRGPGCSLPVRFISVLPYVEWIESVINEALMRMNSEKIRPRVKEVPLHTLYAGELEEDNEEIREFDGIPYRKASNSQRKASKLPPGQEDEDTKPDYDGLASDYDRLGQGSGRRASAHRRLYIPPNVTDGPPVLSPKPWQQLFYEDKDWKRDDIRHMDPNVLQFTKFGNKYERSKGDCTKVGHLVYKEITQVTKTPNIVGYAYYKLSLIDLEIYKYTCIVIRVKSKSRSDCNLWYSIARTLDEPLEMLDDTPKEILTHYIPVGDISTAGPFETNALYWKPHQTLEAFFKKEGDPLVPRWWMNQTMLNLYLKFDFVDDAELILEVWGPSSESLHEMLSIPTPPPMINVTRTRLKGHHYTRPTRRRTKRSTIHIKRTRTRPTPPPTSPPEETTPLPILPVPPTSPPPTSIPPPTSPTPPTLPTPPTSPTLPTSAPPPTSPPPSTSPPSPTSPTPPTSSPQPTTPTPPTSPTPPRSPTLPTSAPPPTSPPPSTSPPSPTSPTPPTSSPQPTTPTPPTSPPAPTSPTPTTSPTPPTSPSPPTSPPNNGTIRMKKALISKMGKIMPKSGSSGSNYVESGLCLILILFISTFR